MRGVCLTKEKNYKAVICIDGKRICLGTFPTQGVAAIEYANIADEWFGKDMWWPYKDSSINRSEYKIWRGILSRCFSESNEMYRDYGGRGITVCDRWRKSFYAFIMDMGEKPSKEYSVDRIDNNGNYSPSNCKWSTKSEQSFNQRMKSNNTSGIRGVFHNKRYNIWVASIRYKGKGYYLGSFRNPEQAKDARKKAEIKYFGFNP